MLRPVPTLRPAGRGGRRAALAIAAPPTVNSGPARASYREAHGAATEADRELIQRAQRGDDAAFQALVERHERRAYAIAVGLVRDREDALEIVQEAFLRVHRGLDAFNGAASFFTWLYRIVKNLSIDLMRRPSWQRELSESSFDLDGDHPLESAVRGADPGDLLLRRELGERIQRAFAELPPYHRSVILMREVDGLSYEEMARVAGVSKGTIMSRLFHARKKLQRALADCYRDANGASDEPGSER